MMLHEEANFWLSLPQKKVLQVLNVLLLYLIEIWHMLIITADLR